MHHYSIFVQAQSKLGDFYIPVCLHRALDQPLKNGIEVEEILEEHCKKMDYFCLILTGIQYYGKTYKKKT